MKNFTKVLALVLVVAMALSMVTMASAAFTDDAEITKKAAVSVLSTIGVLKGYDDGSFKPTGDVTRAEMAKMIATILNKGDDVGDIYKGACTFTDTASHWAAGYVAYCAQEKIINGKSATKFDPDGKVTGVEAAKMLLCALGYTPDGAGLVGANWASNTLSLARKDFRNLLDDVDGNMSDNLNRENAAQMLLNALQAVMVESNGNATTISLGDLGSISTNVEFKDRTKETATGTTYVTLMSETFPELKVEWPNDADGRPSTEWTYKGDVIGTFADPLTVSYDKEVTGNTVYTDLGKLNLSKTELFATFYVDGEEVDHIWKNVDGYLYAAKMNSEEDVFKGEHSYFGRIASGSYDTIGANGAKTEVYYDSDNSRLTVVVNRYYYGTLTNVLAAQKTGEEITRSAYVTVDTVNGFDGQVAKAALTEGESSGISFETDAFTSADVTAKTKVAMTLGKEFRGETTPVTVITSMVKAETVTGTVSDYTADASGVTGLTAGGTAYNVAVKGTVTAPELNSDATLYLDPTGAVLYADVVEGGNYAYVLAAGRPTNGLKTETKAELLLADGTIVTVDVAKIDGTAVADTATDSDIQTALESKSVAYSVNTEGKYNLTTNDTATTKFFSTGVGAFTTAGEKIYSGEASLANGYKVNNTTKFVVGIWDTNALESKYTVYTGLSAMPNLVVPKDVTTAAAGIVADSDGLAKVVFIKDAKVDAVANSNMLVFFKLTKAENGSYSADAKQMTADYEDGYFTVKAVVDGEIKSVKITTEAYNGLGVDSGFYFAETSAVDNNGVYTDVSQYAADYAENGRGGTGAKTYKIINEVEGDTYGGYADGVLDVTYDDGNTIINGVKADEATPVYVFNAKDGSFVKADLGTYKPYLGYKEGDNAHKDTAVDGGYFTLDVASARVDTVKVAALYLVVME